MTVGAAPPNGNRHQGRLGIDELVESFEDRLGQGPEAVAERVVLGVALFGHRGWGGTRAVQEPLCVRSQRCQRRARGRRVHQRTLVTRLESADPLTYRLQMAWLSAIPPRGRALSAEERAALEADLELVIDRSHLFRSLDAEGRTHLLSSGYVLALEDGEVLIEEGEEGGIMYLVLDGRVRVSARRTGTAEDVTLAELGRGAVVGEVSVLSGSPRTATVSAVGASHVLAFEAHRIQRVLDAHPEVRRRLQSVVEGRARDAAEKMIGSPESG
jgi:hypothetical protein